MVVVDTTLWEQACTLRRRYWRNTVFLRGIVEFSSHCRQNCLYCGLRRDNAGLMRYRMHAEDIFRAAAAVRALGFGTVVLQSGEDPLYSAGELAGIIRRIKEELQLAVTLSLGERDAGDYALWREAGADRYLLKLETLDADLYARLRPGRTLSERQRALETLQALGYETGTGLIAGLPGESTAQWSQAIARMGDFAPDMLSISPFVPHPDTPLGGLPACSAELAMQAMAMARIAVPTAHIPVTSALGLQGDAVRLAALQVGNVLMPSLTPQTVRAAYAIYPGKNEQAEPPWQRAAAIRDLIVAAGYDVPPQVGMAWRLQPDRFRLCTESFSTRVRHE